MDFALTPTQAALQGEVRAFLRDTLPAGEARDDGWIVGFSREFSRALGARGWIGYTWPQRYGGKEGSYLERLIITEELLRAGAPVGAHWLADRQIGPALLAYGSEEQRSDILPGIARGESVFCIGMSEPNAGSDLASLRTRAVEDGDFFVVDGHKIWTTNAHTADYCYLVARTDPGAPKHKGVSEFLVDMRSPGITVRPLVDLSRRLAAHQRHRSQQGVCAHQSLCHRARAGRRRARGADLRHARPDRPCRPGDHVRGVLHDYGRYLDNSAEHHRASRPR